MKGIKIKTEGGIYKISFEGGFIVIEDDIETPIHTKRGSYKKKNKGNKETRYEAYIGEDGKKRWKLKEKYKGTSVKNSNASKAMVESWKRRKAKAEEDEYSGLAKLNQDLEG